MKVATRAQIRERMRRERRKRGERNLLKRVYRLLPALDPGRPGNIALRKLIHNLLYADKSGVWAASSITPTLQRIDGVVEELIMRGMREYPRLLTTHSPLLAQLLGEVGRYAERRVQGGEDIARAFFGWSERFNAYHQNYLLEQLRETE